MLKRNKFRRWYIYVTLFVSVVAVIVFVLEITNTTHLFHSKKSAIGTASESTKGEPQTASASSDASSGPTNSTTDTSQSSDNKDSSSEGSTNATLITPTGNFVNNHRLSLSGYGGQTMTSVCNTTPGASCQITFTNNGTTKSLASQTTDKGGATYWSWTLSNLGLTVGSWHIKAHATLNGQSIYSDDALTLEISQ